MPILNIDNPLEAKNKFTSFIKSGDVLCLYRMEGCGHCIDFMPIWNKIINQFKNDINVINIEYKSMLTLDNNYHVNGFPSIIIYKNGKKFKEFTTYRTEKNVHDFIKNNMLKTVKNNKINKLKEKVYI